MVVRLMSLADGWNQEAENWIRWARTPGHDSYWNYHRDQFLPLLPPPGRLTVDVGCGEGRFPRDLKRLGHTVIGFDVVPALTRAARSADPTGQFCCANAASLPLRDGCCDLVTAFMSLHDVDDLAGAVLEMSRVLREDGTVCLAIVHPLNSAGSFTDVSPTSPYVITGTYLGEFQYDALESRDGLSVCFHSKHRPLETYSRALERAGFLMEAIREPPRPDSGGGGRWQRVPLFLHVRARKTAAN